MGEFHNNDKEKYACWLCSVPGVGDKTIKKLREICPNAEGIYKEGERLWKQVMNERQLASIRDFAARNDPDAVFGRLGMLGISFVSLDLSSDSELGGDNMPVYPRRLRNIPDPPYGIFYKGMLPREDRLSVAVVGARECSAYGRYVAQGIGAALGEYGVQVISGMARGIDGISQGAALAAGGSSFGVLGCGVDICYPKSNLGLYEELCEKGGILSAYPPGTEPRPQNFPPRNRIVSGLADVLIVVEARSKSGTLITVDMALEQGREVYAVPGRVTDRLSDGCNRLLKQGACVFLSPEDFLREMGTKPVPTADSDSGPGQAGTEAGGTLLEVPRRQAALEGGLQAIYEVLSLEPQSVEEIARKLEGNNKENNKGNGKLGGDASQKDIRKLTISLMQLCMEGLAVQVTPGWFALLQFAPNRV